MSNTSESQWIKKPRNLVWETIMSLKLYLWLWGYRTPFSNNVEFRWYDKTNLYENMRTQFATIRKNSLNLSKKMVQLARVLVADKILQNSSINHLVWMMFIKYKMVCILLEAMFQSEGLSKKLSCQGLFFSCRRVWPILITENNASYFFSSNLRPSSYSTRFSHVPTLILLPKRPNIGETSCLHYMYHGLINILVDKLLSTTAKFLEQWG